MRLFTEIAIQNVYVLFSDAFSHEQILEVRPSPSLFKTLLALPGSTICQPLVRDGKEIRSYVISMEFTISVVMEEVAVTFIHG